MWLKTDSVGGLVTSFLTLSVMTVLIVFLAYWNWKRRYLYIASSKMAGPLALPIIGNGYMFMCKNSEVLMRLYQLVKPHYDPIRIWFGPKLLICLVNPNHAEKILSSTKFAQKHDIYEFIKPYLGEGLVSGSGPVYKKHRRIIQPIFDLNFARDCVPTMQKHINICMEKLEKYVDKGTFRFDHVVHKCMVDLVKEIIFGIDSKCQSEGYTAFDQAMLDVYDFSFTRLVKPWLHPDIIFNNTPLKKRQDEIRNTLQELGHEVVINSRKRRKLTKVITEFIPVVDRLSQFIEDNPGVIESEIFIDHLLTLHAAAEDTLTQQGGFISMCLGMYPEYQEKAAAEIREIFGETPREVRYVDIQKLVYVDMCIKDSLRLFPIAPYILRKCTEDYELEKWLIPKDSSIAVAAFNIHRDPRHWQNPEHFYPDHFLPEFANKRHIYAYIPFSAGPRGCIGKILASIGLKVFMCNLLQKFEIEADGKLPDLELRMDISTRPIHGYNLRLKKRVWK